MLVVGGFEHYAGCLSLHVHLLPPCMGLKHGATTYVVLYFAKVKPGGVSYWLCPYVINLIKQGGFTKIIHIFFV